MAVEESIDFLMIFETKVNIGFTLRLLDSHFVKDLIKIVRHGLVWKRCNFCLCYVPALTSAHSFYKETKSTGKFQ